MSQETVPPSQQQAFGELHYRYGYVPRRAGAKLLGVSNEAFRCRTRRLRARGLLGTAKTPGELVYSFLTAKGARAFGVAPPKELGAKGLWARLAIAEACAIGGYRLLTQEELLTILVSFEARLGGGLAVPGLPRARWRVEEYLAEGVKRSRLSFLHVDLGPEPTAHGIVARVGARARKLAARGPAWRAVLLKGYLSFTVVTAGDRSGEIRVAARAAHFGVPLSFAVVPLLRHAAAMEATP